MKSIDKISIIILTIILVTGTYIIFTLGKSEADHNKWLKRECSEFGEYYLLGEKTLGEEVVRIDCINGEGEVRVKYYIRGEK